MTIGLIRGAAALSFANDFNKDSERRRILISMTICAIWKSKIENSINDQDVAPKETSGVLKGLITDLITKSWNAIRSWKAIGGKCDNVKSGNYGRTNDGQDLTLK